MQPSKTIYATALLSSLMFTTGIQIAEAGYIEPDHHSHSISDLKSQAQSSSNLFALDADTDYENLFALDADADYEKVQFVSCDLTSINKFVVNEAGTYELTITDMVFPEPLTMLGATVTTATDSLTKIIGSGTALFDMQVGTYYLSYFAQSSAPQELGLFGLTLRMNDGGTPSPVPAPAALWMFGSGLIALAGMVRRREIP